MEYIQNTSTSYLDTGLVSTADQSVEVEFSFDDLNNNYAIFGMLSATSIKVGTYNSEKATVEITHSTTGQSIGALITKVVVAGNPLKKDFTVEAEVVGDDNKLYLIHLSKSKTTDLEELKVDVSVQKLIKNGQLIIISNGIEYSPQGTILK